MASIVGLDEGEALYGTGIVWGEGGEGRGERGGGEGGKRWGRRVQKIQMVALCVKGTLLLHVARSIY